MNRLSSKLRWSAPCGWLGFVVVFFVAPNTAQALFHPANHSPRLAPSAHLEVTLQLLEGATEEFEDFHEGTSRQCGTSEILQLDRAWEQLDPPQKERLRNSLSSPARGGSGTSGRGEFDERGTISCFLSLSNQVESEHFSIQWGDSGSVSISDAEAMLANLEETRTTFLEAGYFEPLGNPNYRVPVYLGNSGGAAPSIGFDGGYATVCASYQHAYVVLSGIDSSTESLDVVNHELFHTVQMGSPNPYEVDSFYWEASAVWAEKLAAPDRTYYVWPLPSYTANTAWPLGLDNEIASNDGFLHKYAMFILSSYLDEFAPSGDSALLEVWNGGGAGLEDRLNSFWAAEKIDTTFAKQFGHFTSHVSFMDFDHQEAYLNYPVVAHGSLTPDEPLTETDPPDTYGSHFYEVDLEEAGGDRTKLQIVLDAPQGWVLALATSDNGTTVQSGVWVVNEEGVAEGSALDVDELGEQTGWVVVTNTGTSDAEYSLSVQFVEPSPDDYDDLGSEGQGCSGCGNDAPKPHPFEHGSNLALALLLIVPGISRRWRLDRITQ